MDELWMSAIEKLQEKIKNQEQKRMIFIQELIGNLDLMNIGDIKQIAYNEKKILTLQDENVKIIKRRMESISAYPLLVGKDILPRLSSETGILMRCLDVQNYDASIFDIALFFQRLSKEQVHMVIAIDDEFKTFNNKEEIVEKLTTDSNNNLKEIQTGTGKILRKTK